MRCLCCGTPLSEAHRKQGGFSGKANTLPDYCGCVCYAAHKTLSEGSLRLWRRACWRLDVNPMRAS